ncbi:MAG: hypothetical protein HKN29_12565 [Rhodothermales bacterium]|nr:hypothetical protein [Rhodothermales bacterium]
MRLVLAFGLLVVCTGTADAQALPDLAPREVEIRGELTISFPSLRRQPLVGFNPPPRIPEIGLRRMPYVEAYKQTGAELPQNPLRNPTTPRALPMASGQGFNGTIETGFGRYSTRYLNVDAALYATSSTRWTVRGDYDGATSWAPHGFNAEADGFSGVTRYVTTGSRSAFGFDLGGSSHAYRLFGVDTAGTAGTSPSPRRTRSDLLGTAWFGSGSDSRLGYRLQIEGFTGRVSTDAFEAEVAPGERDDAGVSGQLEVNSGGFALDAAAGSLTLDSAENPGRAVGHFDAGASVRFDLGRSTTVRIGGRALGFEASGAATGGSRRALTYASPLIEIESVLAPNVRLELSQRPHLDNPRPGNRFREQPYLSDEVHIEPTLFDIDATVRLRGFWRTIQASMIATYQGSPNYRYVEHAPTNYAGYPRGLSALRYGEARTLSLGGEVRLSPTPGVEARLGARVQDGRLTSLDADLPYFSRWVVSGMLSSGFANRRGLIQLTSEVLGPRAVDAAGGLDTDTVADLDVRISYGFVGGALVALELRNMLGETPYWYNYPEAPATVVLGVGWRW